MGDKPLLFLLLEAIMNCEEKSIIVLVAPVVASLTLKKGQAYVL